jgi:hypothetical protein
MSYMKPWAWLKKGALSGLLMLATACGVSDQNAQLVDAPEEPSMEHVGVQGSALYLVSNKIWRFRNIRVCWENPRYYDAAENQAREWVFQAVVNDTWGKVSNANFFGWGTCAPGDGGVRIRIEDTVERPRVLDHGSGLDGRVDGMRLNFTFQNALTACQSPTMREGCIKSVAVHEFGHALGFAHEQNRLDTQCYDSRDGVGDLTLGTYDPTSIMNYCNPDYGVKWNLSPRDIEGVQKVYGATPGALVTLPGSAATANKSLCVGVSGDGTSNWTRTELQECDRNRVSQRWTHLLNDSLRGENSYRCLDVEYGSTSNGSPTQIFDCNGGAGGQKWSFKTVEIRAMAGKCLGVVNNGYTAWTRTELQNCTGSSTQKWSLMTNGELRHDYSGLCLDVYYGQSTNGTPTQLYNCNGGIGGQRWTTDYYGKLRSAVASNKCLHVYNGNTAAGTPVQISDCTEETAQRWYLQGKLTGGSGRCLGLPGGTASVGSGVQIWDCSSTATQTWNYFP